MARVCEICGRGPDYGHSVSHSGKRTRKVRAPNLQRVRAVINGVHRRIRVCTRCLKAGKVQKA
ncbi:50S ribosomal protein L28 [Candidatus Bipolaricaulota bacterium]|nr:50S ribosomal protein L28 [Candidatus Bipolaricaulota bacterium]